LEWRGEAATPIHPNPRKIVIRTLALGFLLFVIAEMAVLILLGRTFGVFPTIAIVLGAGVLGAWVARWQAAQAALRARSSLAQGAVPTGDMADGLLIALAAVLLIVPGVITDVAGLVLLFPPTRAAIRRSFAAEFSRRTPLGAAIFGMPTGGSEGASTDERDRIIDARVIETRVVDE
jgi:UPF0716 protein FxsA